MVRAVEPRPTGTEAADQYVRSYIGMRFLIGLLALALPPLVVLVDLALVDREDDVRGSLSAYYYSGAREIFVGGLCAIGVFLISYKLVQRSLENVFSVVAGLLAIVVAFFPTKRPGDGYPETPLQLAVGEDAVTWIHYRAAVVFIVLLAGISLLFAWFGRRRRFFHAICAAAIVVAGGLGIVWAGPGGVEDGILYGEWAAVWAFAASWLATVEFRLLFLGPRSTASA